MNANQREGSTLAVEPGEELGVQCPICRTGKTVPCKRYGQDQSSHLERHAEWLMHLAEINVISGRGMPLWNSVLMIVEQLPEAEYLLWRDRNLRLLRHLAFDEPAEYGPKPEK